MPNRNNMLSAICYSSGNLLKGLEEYITKKYQDTCCPNMITDREIKKANIYKNEQDNNIKRKRNNCFK